MKNILDSLPLLFISSIAKNNSKVYRAYQARLFIILLLSLTNLSGCMTSLTNPEQTLSALGDNSVNYKELNARNIEETTKAHSSKSVFTDSKLNEMLPNRAVARMSDLAMESDEDKILTAAERRERAINGQRIIADDFPPEKERIIDYAAVAKQYEELLKGRTNPEKNENVLYQLARAYDLSGQLTNSLDSLTRLIQQYPFTKRRNEIQFRRGELLFQLKVYPDAEEAYASVLDSYDSPYYERSLYKHAWCVFKQSELPRALKSFYQLLDAKFKGDKDMKDFSRSDRNLLDDTFRVVSQIYASMKGHESIREHSLMVGTRNYEYQIFSRLSKLYLDQDRFNDAAKSLNAFVELYPNNTHSPQILLAVIDIFEKGGFANSLIESKVNFVTRYGFAKGFWTLQDSSLLVEMAPFIKENLMDLAKHYHSLGQKSNKTADYKVAARWYREYVTSFPTDSNTVRMNFLLAENLNEGKSHSEAAIEYENTAYNYGDHKDAAEAAYAAILIHQNQMIDLKGKERKSKRLKTMSSAIRFVETFPNDARSPAVLLKVGEDYLELKQMELAAMTAHKIINYKTKESKKLEKSAYAIIAVAEFSLGNHKKAELVTVRHLKMMSPHAKDRKVYQERLAASVYKQGEEARNSGKLELAINHFLRLGKLVPNSTIRVTAEYDAASTLLQMGAWDRAVPVFENIVRRYPKHKLALQAATQLALSYEKKGKWGRAANMYTKIVKREKDPERRRGLLWQTADLYARSGKLQKSISTYKSYISKYKEPIEQSIEARQIIADTYTMLKKSKKRNYWLKKIIEVDKTGKSTERTTYLAAKASLELAEPTYKRYQEVRLVKPFKKNLLKKKKLLQKSVDVYTLAANYGVAEITTAATYQIAEIYVEFSKELFASERPQGLSPIELEQYDILLEEQAFPFEEKAINVHESNALRVRAGIYNKWVQHSMHSLRTLQPVRYRKSERSELLLAEY